MSDGTFGVGIHSGEISFGKFGRFHRDLTAICTVVNATSRAQSAAGVGQILVTQAVYEQARSELPDSPLSERVKNMRKERDMIDTHDTTKANFSTLILLTFKMESHDPD